MNKVISVACLIFLSISVFAQKKPKIKGDKELLTITNALERGFNKIEIDDALEVSVKQSNTNNYVLTTDRNLHEVIKFSVLDSILKIYTTSRIVKYKKLDISLNCVNLEQITLKNEAEIKGEGTVESKKMLLNAYSDSRFELDLKAEDVVINMHGKTEGKIKLKCDNSEITMSDKSELEASVLSDKIIAKLIDSAELDIEGDSNTSEFSLKDKSNIDAQKMKISSVDLYCSGNIDANIYAGKQLSLFAEGKTTIYIYGEPKIEVKEFKDKSKLIKK